jgi:SAM-dependent methyltransferase
VLQQDFLRLDLPLARFDGVFANASLFHVPSRNLARVLQQLHSTLKPGGVLFSSNPRGANQEGWSHGRYGSVSTCPDHAPAARSRDVEAGRQRFGHGARAVRLHRER